MYELNLSAPSGDIKVGLTAEAAEVVKAAVFAALLAPAPAPAPVAARRPRHITRTAPKMDRIRNDAPALLPLTSEEAVTIETIAEALNEAWDEPVSPSYVEKWLRDLLAKRAVERRRVGHGFVYWRPIEGVVVDGVEIPGQHRIATPEVHVDRNGFTVTLDAEEGVVKGTAIV